MLTNLILFLSFVVCSFIVVRIGAIAFQLTGVSWPLAKFQSLSCFTGTGFTTRESELITSDPRRRRIATILIVLGHAGLVSMIATFANTIRPSAIKEKLAVPYLPFDVPYQILPWVNIGVIAVGVYVIYRVFTNANFVKKMTRKMRRLLVRQSDVVRPVTFEELMFVSGGFGISRISINRKNSLIGKTLRESRLRRKNITVLAIERKETTTANPPADSILREGDELICFGNLDRMKEIS
ncbi:hypothetical protein STSP2_00729 [Anaerohalosphaera lusitana]|uniref:RCK C-terminal domain-containing protein n=1 Tax=Anaerohalosphaera lusitana TaxID=1936003 RepID=A0A1U9NI32_9BACT|nr:TrkA C-terminal domain-containing protein [Anaerohalosphaera lusitana]AQT67581.1 hypothetical protein STSP2_00729 [Anaerohalosphaera lusitana]